MRRKGYLVRPLRKNITALDVYAHRGNINKDIIKAFPRPIVAQLAKWVYFAHIVVWTGVFLWIFVGLGSFAQSNCNGTVFPFQRYRIGMGAHPTNSPDHLN